MKRVIITALVMLSLIIGMAVPALAEDTSMSFRFVLQNTAGAQEVQVEPGDTFTVYSVLMCTSIAGGGTYELETLLQTEIVYDNAMLELRSAEYGTEFRNDNDDIASRDLNNREGNYRRIMINSGAEASGTKPAEMVLAELTFRARDDASGKTTITNENADVSSTQKVGLEYDKYTKAVTDMTVTIGTTEPDTYAVTIDNPTGGTISVTPTGNIAAGTTVNLGITLAAGYSMSLWSVTAADGTSVRGNGYGTVNASFVMPEQAVTITATLNYTSPGGGGGGGGAPEQEIAIDDEEVILAAPDTPRFDDVGTEHWAYTFVEYLAELGFVNGKTDTMYYPGDNITRGEFITILARMSGENMPSYGGEFDDVRASDFYAGPVSWGYANGIVKGTSTTTFSPNDKVTRQDIAVMIARYANYKGYGFGKVNEESAFIDENMIADYAVEAVSSMQQANIINGYEDNSFKPRGNATRAEAAKMLALVHHAMFPHLLD